MPPFGNIKGIEAPEGLLTLKMPTRAPALPVTKLPLTQLPGTQPRNGEYSLTRLFDVME